MLGCILFAAGHTTQAGGRIMGWKFTFATSLAVLLLFAAPSKLFAQCTWCQTVTDACCDGTGTAVNYQIGCTTSEIYVQYDISNLNRVLIELTNLDTSTTLFSGYLSCDCDRAQIWKDNMVPLASGTNLRLKASCEPCTQGGDCAIGNVNVKFFTPSSNTCAPNCSGS